MRGTQRSNVLAPILFIAGLAIVVLALILLAPGFLAGRDAFLFVAVDAIVLYLLLFSPLLVGEHINDLTGGRIVSLGIYWYAVGAYALLSATLIFITCTSLNPPLKLFVILQAVGLFGVGFAAFMGDAAHGQVEHVEEMQAQQLSMVRDLRSSSEQLAITVAHIGATDNPAMEELVKATERIADDLRYLTPVQTQQAALLEQRIQSDLNTLAAGLGYADPNMIDVRGACDVARDALLLIAQRKALRN